MLLCYNDAMRAGALGTISIVPGSQACQQLEFAGLMLDDSDAACDTVSYQDQMAVESFHVINEHGDRMNWLQVEDVCDVLYKIARQWSVEFAVQK